MAITLVQTFTGANSAVTATGVTAGNCLIIFTSYFRGPSTGGTETTPTDSNGTVAIALAATPSNLGAIGDIGTSIFYVKNANSGSHTITPQANGAYNTTVLEFSGLDTAAPFDVSTSALTSNANQTSQVTGTTATTAQASELVVIGLGLGAQIGTADVGFTDPVSGFTTARKVSNDLSDLATFHAYKTVSSTGTQTATFNWTDPDTGGGNASHAAIATFKAAAGGAQIGSRRRRGAANHPGDGPRSLGKFVKTRRNKAPASNVSLALTGVSAATSVGTVPANVSYAASGVAATAQAGNLTPAVSTALTGIAATTAAGTVVSAVTQAMTGTAGTTAAGTLASDISVPLTGAAASAAAGSVAPSSAQIVGSRRIGKSSHPGRGPYSYGKFVKTQRGYRIANDVTLSLTGVAATASAGTLAPSISYTMSGAVGTASAGTPVASVSLQAAGAAATSSPGTLSDAITVALTGAAATSAPGNVSAVSGVVLALTGVAGTASPGTVAPAADYELAGLSVTSIAGSLILPGSDGSSGAHGRRHVRQRYAAYINGKAVIGDLEYIEEQIRQFAARQAEKTVAKSKPTRVRIVVKGTKLQPQLTDTRQSAPEPATIDNVPQIQAQMRDLYDTAFANYLRELEQDDEDALIMLLENDHEFRLAAIRSLFP